MNVPSPQEWEDYLNFLVAHRREAFAFQHIYIADTFPLALMCLN